MLILPAVTVIALKRRIQLLVTALAAALIFGRAAADSPYSIDVWGTEDGLPQSSVIAITQTHDGYLWLGTINGLVRFDGNSMTPINVNNTPALPDNFITFLYEDSKSNLWVGTANAGLCVFHGGEARQIDISGAGGKIIFADENAAGEVRFLSSAFNFFSVTNGKIELLPTEFPRLYLDRFFHLVLPGKNGVVWELRDGRVNKFRGNQLEKTFGATPWTYERSPMPFGLPIYYDANVMALCEDRDGNLVVATHDDGVYWYDASGHATHIPTNKEFSHDSVLSLYCDNEGDLWAGTDGDGLERISKKAYTEPTSYSPGIALSSAEDEHGGIWTTFDRRGLTYALTNKTIDFGIGYYTNASSVLVDGRQEVWAGTRNEGLFRFNPTARQFQPVTDAQSLGAKIFTLFESRDKKLWVGGTNCLGSYDGKDWRFYTAADGLPTGAIRALAEDSNSNLWIGFDGAGICVLHEGRISSANAPVKDVSCFLYDRDDVLWVGTAGHGLARLANGRWTEYGSTTGLTVDDIGYLIDDPTTNLWIGSYEGLLRADKASLAEYAADTAQKISCRTFLTRECSTGFQPAAIRTAGGHLLFPTIAGLIAVDPTDLRRNTNLPPVVIESVLVDGVPQQEEHLATARTDAIILQPEDEQLEIHFTALTFSAPKGSQFGARFRFQLTEHVDRNSQKNWTDIGPERIAHFQKLAPGNYTFLVQACNEDGVWNESGASIAVIVEPPFWRKPGFIICSVLVLLGALAGTIYLVSTAKLKRQLRKAQQKEMIEHERARIARDLHDQLGANLTQITLLGEMAETDREIPEEIEQHAQQICSTARETTRSLDEIVWAVNPSNDTLESLANYACKYAQDYFATAGISYRAELPPGLPPVPILPEVRHNIFLAFKEAVNNVVKHAQATEARVKLQLEPDRFILSVTDNGRGLGDISDKKLRNGLRNMRRRLSDVHGEFDISPAIPSGTVVKLTVPTKR